MSEGAGSAVVSKRLQQELMSLMMSGDEGISAFPKDDNLFEWLGTIHGSAGTVYEGLEYKISLKFGPKYPNEPPQCKFTTRVFHPNVDAQSGSICLDILTADKWSAVLDVRALLVSLRSLLSEPNNDSPLNNQAALLYVLHAANIYQRVLQHSRDDACRWGKPDEFRRQVMAVAANQ